MQNSKKITVSPNPGPQTVAAGSRADILIYGGGAGGGKSFYLVNEPLRHINNRNFRAGIFRRTYPQIRGQGGIWDEARQTYPHFGAKMREGTQLDAVFPSQASIAFLHCQHEKTKYDYQGHQFGYLAFDELTHFTESQFFYLLSRNRTTCGIRPYCRASCNPDAGSWVASFISWWIDQDSGFPIPERCGQLRYFVREDDELIWASDPNDLVEQFPEYQVDDLLSVTFVPASLDDNPVLLEKDKGYRSRLRAQPKIERERLEKGNWKAAEGAIISKNWLNRYEQAGDITQLFYHGELLELNVTQLRRFATIDTAGTSKEKAAEMRGDPPSYSVCAVWDHFRHRDNIHNYDVLILRHVWRDQVDWNDLKRRIPEVLRNWNVPVAVIENAHYGQPLAMEMKGQNTKLVGPKIPGMDDTSRGAKLERAIASGFLSRLEDIGIWIPEREAAPWVNAYVSELTSWTGLPKETADQIDVSSYAAFHVRQMSQGWGGPISI